MISILCLYIGWSDSSWLKLPADLETRKHLIPNDQWSGLAQWRSTQQTQNICIIFIQCWTNVEDVGPTLYKCYTNVLCLAGMDPDITVCDVHANYPHGRINPNKVQMVFVRINCIKL